MSEGVIVITGAGSGLGKELAIAAHGEGFAIALIGRTKAKLEAVREILVAERADVTVHPIDLTDEKATRKEFDRIAKTHGSLRALVNNAGTWMGTGKAAKTTAEDMRSSLDLNFFSAVHATTSALGIVGTKPKHDFAIVNVGATASLDAWPEVLPFCLAKGALRGYSRALGRELGPAGIHVAHLVIDGMLDNERTRKLNRGESGNRFLRTDAVARGIVEVILQEKSCWTMEWDVRPHTESW